MKTLIVIPSCARDRFSFQVRQRTQLHGYEYKFFLGAGNWDAQADEVILPVRDDYMALPDKVRHAFRWAIDHDYDYVFKTDCDTFIYPDRLLNSDFARADYIGLVGSMITQNLPGDCCGGGAGYWLSRLAMIAYLQSYGEFSLMLANWQKMEDWCLYTTLHRNTNIRPLHDPRFWDLRLGPIPNPQTNITWNRWEL